jgi:hypothetical protein
VRTDCSVDIVSPDEWLSLGPTVAHQWKRSVKH